MNRLHRDPRPGLPSPEERRKTTQRVSRTLATSSVDREALTEGFGWQAATKFRIISKTASDHVEGSLQEVKYESQ
jgi:hypothetical protein